MTNEIFISYRRSDAGWAGRLYDRLEKEFESEGVFIDVVGIDAGRDFDTTIKEQAESSKVMLTIIGNNWISDDGIERLRSPEDYVRREIEIGLCRKDRVIPILIEETPYLTAVNLPESLRDLAAIQALKITHQGFRSDAEKLIDVTKVRLEQMTSGGRRTWDRTLFLGAARTRGASLEKRLQGVLDWVETKRYMLRWGNGAKYGTANIAPKDSALTVLSVDTTGLVFIFMNNLQKMGVFSSAYDRHAFIDQLNNI
jgi:hypothetical protein